MIVRRVVVGLACVLLTRSLQASTDTLVQLCRVWSAVKFLDPQLMTREIDWDGALIRAIPAARAAASDADSAAAIAAMLRALDDPATRVVGAPHEHAKPQLFSWDGDVLIVNIGPYADSVRDDGELLAARNALGPELAKATRVIIDLRTESAETPGWLLDETALVDQTIAVPAQRHLFRSGYPSQLQSKSGGYYAALQVVASTPISAAPKSTHVPSRIVLITRDDLPPNAARCGGAGRRPSFRRRRALDRTPARQRASISATAGRLSCVSAKPSTPAWHPMFPPTTPRRWRRPSPWRVIRRLSLGGPFRASQHRYRLRRRRARTRR